MNPDFLDRHSRRDSVIHRLPAAVKLGAAIFLVVTTVLMPVTAWIYYAGLAFLLVGATLLSRVPVGFLAGRLLLLSLLVAGMTLLSSPHPAIFAKSLLSLLTVLLLANTTPFSELLRVLRQLHVPAVFVTTLALMYRYLFVLVDEAERMKRARQARTLGKTRWPVLAGVLGQLFVRSTERAERIHAAMTARGWR